MPRDPEPRLMFRTFEDNSLAEACDEASAFVAKIPGGRMNFQSVTTTYRQFGLSYAVTVWYWKW